MNINEAIIKRITELCREKNVNVCEAALNGGKSPSAIYDILKGRTKCSKVSTINIHQPSWWFFIFGHSPACYWRRALMRFTRPASHACVTYYP